VTTFSKKPDRTGEFRARARVAELTPAKWTKHRGHRGLKSQKSQFAQTSKIRREKGKNKRKGLGDSNRGDNNWARRCVRGRGRGARQWKLKKRKKRQGRRACHSEKWEARRRGTLTKKERRDEKHLAPKSAEKLDEDKKIRKEKRKAESGDRKQTAQVKPEKTEVGRKRKGTRNEKEAMQKT